MSRLDVVVPLTLQLYPTSVAATPRILQLCFAQVVVVAPVLQLSLAHVVVVVVALALQVHPSLVAAVPVRLLCLALVALLRLWDLLYLRCRRGILLRILLFSP